MTEKTVTLEEPYDPRTALFWGRFAAEAGQQERHCPTFALYETAEGDFFYVSETREGQRPDPNPLTKDSKVRTKPIPGTRVHVFERRIDMLSWLDDILRPLTR